MKKNQQTFSSETSTRQILVVGTTEDYIEWIEKEIPGQAVFLVDEDNGRTSANGAPLEGKRIFAPLLSAERTAKIVMAFVQDPRTTFDGIVCFDCEYLDLAAKLAEVLSLSYPSLSSVLNCRSKFISKKLWQENGVPCPLARKVSSLKEALTFMAEVNSPCVIKPLSGSGSELVFLCRNEAALKSAYDTVEKGLQKKADHPLYVKHSSTEMAIESYIDGEEFSCDAVIENGRVEILRIARKIGLPGDLFGTIRGYFFSTSYPGNFINRLKERLEVAARALGLETSIFMVDFIVKNDEIYMLEMTPRPGGDCIPHAIKHIFGFDMLLFALDFSQRKASLPLLKTEDDYVAVRLFAEEEGTLLSVETDEGHADSRVLDLYLKVAPGHTVKLPPTDYDSRILGHVLFKPDHSAPVEKQMEEIAGLFHIVIERSYAQESASD